jgi:hypothetical protein
MQQGRKRGDSYKRRTNAEIARDKQNEDRAAAQQAQVHKQRRETFFNPSAKVEVNLIKTKLKKTLLLQKLWQHQKRRPCLLGDGSPPWTSLCLE